MSLEAKANEPFRQKVQSKIYCEAKKQMHFAGPPLDCEICRWKDECVVYGVLAQARQLAQNFPRINDFFDVDMDFHRWECQLEQSDWLIRLKELFGVLDKGLEKELKT